MKKERYRSAETDWRFARVSTEIQKKNGRKQKQAQRIRDADIRNVLNETPTPTPSGPFPIMLMESNSTSRKRIG